MLNIIIKILFVLIALYSILLIVAYFIQDKLLFFPGHTTSYLTEGKVGFDKELFAKTTDGQTINALWYSQPKSENVIVYFHGNTGSLKDWENISGTLMHYNCNLILVDFRGYGKSTGSFSENGFYLDGEAVISYLNKNGFDDSKIILFGRSLGSGVATEMAKRHQLKALILESPYTSMPAVGWDHYPFLLPPVLLKYKFSNLSKISHIKIPVLILHGDADKVIDVKQARKLFSLSNKSLTHYVEIKNGGHNDLNTYKEYENAIRNFISAL